MQDLLQDYPVIIEVKVDWGHMDAFQHVNNTMYFRYFENVRIAHFDKIKMLEYMEEHGQGPILAATSCKFRLPVTFPDTLSVGSRIIDIENDRFTMEYLAVSHKFQKIAAQGEGKIVFYNYRQQQKAILPESIKQRMI